MADAVIFMQWDSYATAPGGRGFFSQEPLAFNSRQERLCQLGQGSRLWLVSRCPADQQYYFVAVLHMVGSRRNPPESPECRMYGEFAVLADRARSIDLGTRFPAEGLLRAFEFDSGRPVKQGASIGQSFQTLRVLNSEDTEVLNAVLGRTVAGEEAWWDAPCGLWTKCDAVFADYFLKNWLERKQPLAFLLYDPPPALLPGAPVFIHSDKSLRLVATFRGAQFVAGYKPTVEETERIAERERVWREYRAGTIDPPPKAEFDRFWSAQHGVRSLFFMDGVSAFSAPVTFRDYGRALGWGYPLSVGYRYLTLAQSYLLLCSAELYEEIKRLYLHSLISAVQS